MAEALNINANGIINANTIEFFDVIVTNPPFGSRIPIKDGHILEQFQIGYIWRNEQYNISGETGWTISSDLQTSVSPEQLFIERCLQFLRPGGRLAILTQAQATRRLVIDLKNSSDVDSYTALKLYMSSKDWNVNPTDEEYREIVLGRNPVSAAPVIDFVSLKELENKVFPPMQWIVDDLIPEGLIVLAGAPKIGKSFLSWNLALAVAQGGVFLSEFQVSQPRKVLYFALDNNPQRQIQNRLKMIQPDASLPDTVHLCTNFPICMQDEGLETWENTIREVDLVIVDTLKQVVQSEGRGSFYDQDYDMLRPIHAMVHRLGVSMLLVTHTRKMVDVENPFNMIQGSVGVQAACDTMMMLVKEEGEKLLHVNGRKILPAEIGVEIKQSMKVLALNIQIRQTNQMERIHSALRCLAMESD